MHLLFLDESGRLDQGSSFTLGGDDGAVTGCSKRARHGSNRRLA
jgi:hypothetical protein